MRTGAVAGRIADTVQTGLIEFVAGRRAVEVNGTGNGLADFSFKGDTARRFTVGALHTA